mmetsp:Transcript_3246/g.9428  ORF Transcript_3246/g.9428 Transcript_3246/m.9428 type:complete len:150 (-) Transcript_3246:1124-1573(-)|eukprot:CAMPEP_0118873778 /NCGR_PEP_ID=MMETSP1163-20130328/15444_1 /TAXON_ID=124430 /ORGANISM="Phaeomonas parva, Strain CCMP2877" /LENGTH=149 /DNA_ID=CAMNT_0006809085 /DNA_START=130 /DNA_END=579 /DNA_ORIENTATION=+
MTTTQAAEKAAAAPPAQTQAVRGKPASGRSWKKPQKARSSSMVTKANAGLRSSWDKKMAKRRQAQEVRELQRALREEKRREIEEQKQQRLERARVREENTMKNTTYHLITDDTKLKKMNKKQLKSIKKLQVNAKTGAKELVSPWQGKRK